MSLVHPMCRSLCKGSPYAILQSILVPMVLLLGVNSTQMCRTDHCLLQLVKGSLMHSCPLPG